MRRSRTRVAFAVSLFTTLLLVPSIALAQAKHTSTQKPKTPKATTTKPKSTTKKTKKPNTTPSRSVHTTTSRTTNTASKATHTTLHRTTQHYYAGRTPKSMTWYRHHNRRHWMYEVRVRSRAWGTRGFTNPQSAKTFMGYLSHHHFQRYMRHSNNMWVVHYRSLHSHRYGMYRSLGVARRVETSLRQNGFFSWLKWHRVYF